jgi:undecaprenyl-diphosphatase
MKSAVRRLINFRIYLILAGTVSLILAILSKFYPYFFFDLLITKQIQLITNPFISELLILVSRLGNFKEAILSLITVAGAVFIYGYKKEGLMLTLSTLGAVTLSESLKFLIARPRPDALLITQVEKFFRNDSFPSGHVLFFIGFYGYLLYLSYVRLQKKKIRYFFSILFTGLIAVVGVSRIYLGSHWFSDVLAAYLIGSIWLYIVVLISNKLKI